jgi:hypothetical protein
LFPQLIGDLIQGARPDAGRYIETFLRQQSADSLYWPDDASVRNSMMTLSIYRLLTRGRLRVILEGLEDELRNPSDESAATPQQSCERGRLQVEHVMPRSWSTNWPLRSGEVKEDRIERINRIGNLTLLTPTKNAAVSNGPWFGDDPKKHKRALLMANTTFLLNSSLVESCGLGDWTIEAIDRRSEALCDVFLRVWPAPIGHYVSPEVESRLLSDSKSLEKLFSAGLLEVGMTLDLRKGRSAGSTCQVIEGGFLQVDDGSIHKSPSGAASHVRKRSANGWIEWGVLGTETRLRDLWNEYVDRFGGVLDEDNVESEDDDED